VTVPGGAVTDDSTHVEPRVAALTMSRDEGAMLSRWVAYYGGQLGMDNLLVIDDNSVDGSTEGLECDVWRLPAPPWKQPWISTRRRIVNDLSRALLVCYDVVMVTDVDEFLVPDPALHAGLVDYVRSSNRNVVAPLAVNVLHNRRIEPALDPSRAVLEQRHFVKFAPGLCKPLIKRIPAEWMAGFHGIKAPFEVDRELLLLHMKYHDVDSMREVWDHRHRVHSEEKRGGARSEWPIGAEELTSRLSQWVETPSPYSVPEFDPHEVDLTGLIRRKPNGFRVHGTSLKAMELYPLRRLPDRFSAAL
jgi:glycosyl transferase family 2